MPNVKCDFCKAENEGPMSYLEREGWLFYNVSHKHEGQEVRFHGTSCRAHRVELLIRFEELMKHNSLKPQETP